MLCTRWFALKALSRYYKSSNSHITPLYGVERIDIVYRVFSGITVDRPEIFFLLKMLQKQFYVLRGLFAHMFFSFRLCDCHGHFVMQSNPRAAQFIPSDKKSVGVS